MIIVILLNLLFFIPISLYVIMFYSNLDLWAERLYVIILFTFLLIFIVYHNLILDLYDYYKLFKKKDELLFSKKKSFIFGILFSLTVYFCNLIRNFYNYFINNDIKEIYSIWFMLLFVIILYINLYSHLYIFGLKKIGEILFIALNSNINDFFRKSKILDKLEDYLVSKNLMLVNKIELKNKLIHILLNEISKGKDHDDFSINLIELYLTKPNLNYIDLINFFETELKANLKLLPISQTNKWFIKIKLLSNFKNLIGIIYPILGFINLIIILIGYFI
ncbi:MAG: hypothetical protein ACTSVV_12840 [Promethearchaeota archaeon]